MDEVTFVNFSFTIVFAVNFLTFWYRIQDHNVWNVKKLAVSILQKKKENVHFWDTFNPIFQTCVGGRKIISGKNNLQHW